MADQELPNSRVDRPQSAGIKGERPEGQVPASQPDDAVQATSLSFKVLVGIYLCLGFLSIAFGISSALKGSFYVDWTILFLLIGVGLFRRSQPWRTFGVVFGILMVSLCILGLIVQQSWESYGGLLRNMAEMAVGAKWATPALYALVVLLFAFLAFCVWSVFVLTRPNVRAVFESRKDRGFGYFAALCVLLVALTLARETGGLIINLATTKYGQSTSRFRTGPSLADLGAQAPLIIDIKGLETEAVFLITELDVKPVTTPIGGTTTKRSWKWETYTESALVSRAKSRFPQAQHVQVEITRLDIKGSYWFPLFKNGAASFEVSAQGLDGLNGYSSSVSGQLSFDRKGLSSAHDLLCDIGARVAKLSVKEVVQSVTTEVAQADR
jgi:hypothetical protein